MDDRAILGILAILAGLVAIWVAPVVAVAERRWTDEPRECTPEQERGRRNATVLTGLLSIAIGALCIYFSFQ